LKEAKEKESLFKVIVRFIKYNKIFGLFLLILLILVYMIIFGNKGVVYRIKLESEKKELEEQLQTEINKGEYLQKEINELKSSEDKIEKVAREKYGLTKEGEQIYRFKVDSTK
jgi:cell division protein FtsB